jgi:hypothetical protein
MMLSNLLQCCTLLLWSLVVLLSFSICLLFRVICILFWVFSVSGVALLPFLYSLLPSSFPSVLLFLLLSSPSSLFYCNLCESLVIPLLDDTSPSSSLLKVLLFPREGRLHQSPVAGCDGVDVVTDAAVVLVLVFFGCPVVFLVGLMYRYLRY